MLPFLAALLFDGLLFSFWAAKISPSETLLFNTRIAATPCVCRSCALSIPSASSQSCLTSASRRLASCSIPASSILSSSSQAANSRSSSRSSSSTICASNCSCSPKGSLSFARCTSAESSTRSLTTSSPLSLVPPTAASRTTRSSSAWARRRRHSLDRRWRRKARARRLKGKVVSRVSSARWKNQQELPRTWGRKGRSASSSSNCASPFILQLLRESMGSGGGISRGNARAHEADQLFDHLLHEFLAAGEVLAGVEDEHLGGVVGLHPLLVLVVETREVVEGDGGLLGAVTVEDALEAGLGVTAQVDEARGGHGRHGLQRLVKRLEHLELALPHEPQLVHNQGEDVAVGEQAALGDLDAVGVAGAGLLHGLEAREGGEGLEGEAPAVRVSVVALQQVLLPRAHRLPLAHRLFHPLHLRQPRPQRTQERTLPAPDVPLHRQETRRSTHARQHQRRCLLHSLTALL